MRALIIDDVPADIAALRRTLLSSGLVADVASSEGEAISRLLNADYELIVLDPGVPDLNHCLVLSLIKRIAGSLPVVVTSRDDSLPVERTLRELGIYYYIVKPVDGGEFQQVVQGIVGKRTPTEAERKGS